jgi:hypothetical protein
MKRYEVIESKCWRHTSGRAASIYGACPWLCDAERPEWSLEVRGFTIRDNLTNTVGLGRVPWSTREQAQAFADKHNA